MRKITVTAQIRIDLHLNDDAELEEVMDELAYAFTDTTCKATVVDTEIQHWEIAGSR